MIAKVLFYIIVQAVVHFTTALTLPPPPSPPTSFVCECVSAHI